MKKYDISKEEYRHYTIYGVNGSVHGVHINHPLDLYYEHGHQFHRIWDGSIVQLAPAPGPLLDKNDNIIGWVDLAWCPKDKNEPVQF